MLQALQAEFMLRKPLLRGLMLPRLRLRGTRAPNEVQNITATGLCRQETAYALAIKKHCHGLSQPRNGVCLRYLQILVIMVAQEIDLRHHCLRKVRRQIHLRRLTPSLLLDPSHHVGASYDVRFPCIDKVRRWMHQEGFVELSETAADDAYLFNKFEEHHGYRRVQDWEE